MENNKIFYIPILVDLKNNNNFAFLLTQTSYQKATEEAINYSLKIIK